MDKAQLQQELHMRTELEKFYLEYWDKKEQGENVFTRYLRTLDLDYVLSHHITVPELPQTIPDDMKDAYFIRQSSYGIHFLKHDCYTPPVRHAHTFFEFLYIIEGNCIHEVCGQEQHLNMGDFVIVPPGIEHAVSVMNDSIVTVGIMSRQAIQETFNNPLFFRNNLLSDFFMQNIYIKGANNYLVFHTGNDQELRDIIYELMLESENHEREYEVILHSLCGVFFAKLIRYYLNTCEFPLFTGKSASTAYGISSFIKEHYKDVTLNDVAEKFHYTPEYTSKFIKENIGKTFTELVNSYRMENAVSLLQNTNLSVGDIASSIGYLNPESFVRTFKKTYHTTPAAYRKEYTGKLYAPKQ